MPKYNIIYTSPKNDTYLWNGTSLDKLEHAGQEVLLFSGSSVKKEAAGEALKACRQAVKKMFPGDSDPEVKTVEVKVSD